MIDSPNTSASNLRDPRETTTRRHETLANQVKRERLDSGSCDHTELEKDGILCRDVSTNTPSANEVSC